MTKFICSSLPRSFEMVVTPNSSPTACLSSHSSLLGWLKSQGVRTTVDSIHYHRQDSICSSVNGFKDSKNLMKSVDTIKQVSVFLINWTGCWMPLCTKNNEGWLASLEISHGCQPRLLNRSTACVLAGCFVSGGEQNRYPLRTTELTSQLPWVYLPKSCLGLRITATKTQGPISRIQRTASNLR